MAETMVDLRDLVLARRWAWLKLEWEMLKLRLLFEQRFNPHHRPAGPGGGQFTGADGQVGTAPDGTPVVGAANDLVDLLAEAQYRGDYHDLALEWVARAVRAGGNTVETEVNLKMLDGSATARLDLLARRHDGRLYGIEVKTGANPTYTPQQLFVYPHWKSAA